MLGRVVKLDLGDDEAIVIAREDIDLPNVVADMQKVLVGTPADKISDRDYLQETNRYRLV